MDHNTARRLVVLQSYGSAQNRTNPYTSLLSGSLEEHCEVLPFTWRNALARHWDIFHVHWPEVLLRGRTRWRTGRRYAALIALLVRRRLAGSRIVRTVHNIEPHEPGPLLERFLLRRLDRATSAWIVMTDVPTPARMVPRVTIPHGHYRDWFPHVSREVTTGRLLFFGAIRDYKNVQELAELFTQVAEPLRELSIVGEPYSEALKDAITEIAQQDSRITLNLDRVSDETLASEIGASELAVLPYRDLNNSGALLLALSLRLPALVPDNHATRALSNEVGPGWIQLFEHPLTADDLVRAIERVRLEAERRQVEPDLSARDWRQVGLRHLEVYAEARARRPSRHRKRASSSGPA